MGYLRRHAEAKGHPRHVLEGVRSIVVAGMIYGHPDHTPPTPTQGKIARYARGDDYHEILWRKLETLLRWLEAERPGVVGRAACDTAPLLERDFARMAGLGWIGKNTCLIDRKAGSFTVLGSLLVDVELAYDAPVEANHCGTCTRCLDACPTDAFDGPYQLDARRCISYWTIEHKGPIPDREAEGLGGLGVRVRRLPGRLPLESQGPRGPGARARSEAGAGQPGPHRLAGRGGRLFREVAEGDGPGPLEAVGPAPQRRADPGHAAGRRGRAGADRPLGRPGPDHPRGLGLGARSDRLGDGPARPAPGRRVGHRRGPTIDRPRHRADRAIRSPDRAGGVMGRPGSTPAGPS